MQVELKTFSKLNNLDKIYFINNKLAKRESYLKILHYVNIKKWQKQIKINQVANTLTTGKYIEHTYIFNNNQNKINLP